MRASFASTVTTTPSDASETFPDTTERISDCSGMGCETTGTSGSRGTSGAGRTIGSSTKKLSSTTGSSGSSCGSNSSSGTGSSESGLGTSTKALPFIAIGRDRRFCCGATDGRSNSTNPLRPITTRAEAWADKGVSGKSSSVAGSSLGSGSTASMGGSPETGTSSKNGRSTSIREADAAERRTTVCCCR